ncbi:DUF2617 family protein [Janibacter anophelis]|uniref:DUF2617 family protein n=1 Tax=Janibacter anophelis TaxID=319054 RepID=UPI003F7E84D5
MTVTRIHVPFADVSAAGLGWALGLPEQPALAEHTIELGDGRALVLRVLGASHQVLVRDGARTLLSETVACGLPGADTLPERVDVDGYLLTSRVERLEGGQLRRAVDALLTDLAEQPRAVIGAFPGDPHAVTALLAGEPTPGTISWRTWHAYPQTGELVTTSTTTSDAKENP